MTRWRHVILVAVLIVAAVVLTRSRADVHSAAAALPTPTVAAAVTPTDPALHALTVRFVGVWREVPPGGPHEWAGAPGWLTRLAAVATPTLVAGLAVTDPAVIPTGPIVAVETPPAAAVVTFSDGQKLRLTIVDGLVSAVGQG